MATTDVNKELNELPPQLRLAFAPLIKRAMGFAFAMTFGGAVAAVTAYHRIFDPENVTHLWMLNQYFRGFDPETWTGVWVGFLWASWTGFVMGWFFAACRNFVIAAWIFVIRTKANLAANRDFLDHI